jgi:hypothetical protein
MGYEDRLSGATGLRCVRQEPAGQESGRVIALPRECRLNRRMGGRGKTLSSPEQASKGVSPFVSIDFAFLWELLCEHRGGI